MRPGTRGSSPLARGLPQSIPKLTDRTGIIPARAGFTVAAGFADVEGQGSSPLARGLHAVSQIKEGDLRIIPARAGFTFVVVRESSPDLGSSPLARGLPMSIRSNRTRRRIIPARAGFTIMRSLMRPPTKDHPRSRGVYATSLISRPSPAGSSPLARGLRDTRQFSSRAPRIIPARAGFTPRLTAAGYQAGDHPRSRGVYAAD